MQVSSGVYDSLAWFLLCVSVAPAGPGVKVNLVRS